MSYGFNPAADYRAEVRDQAGLLWSVLVKRWGIFAEIVGRENISNAVAVVAFLHANGFEADVIREALRGFRGRTADSRNCFATND